MRIFDKKKLLLQPHPKQREKGADQNQETMNEKYYQTLKSAETEDWLDFHVVRPICYYLAVFFARFDIHPNTVTIMSMFFGVGSSFFFAHGCFHYEGTTGLVCNIVAIVLLIIADLLDCTDGQLARMTGKKSRMGRILDGIAGFVWFVPIYAMLVYRFYCYHDIEFGWLGIANTPTNTIIATLVVLALGAIAGFAGMGAQSRLADYYIQAHLFFLKNEEGSEFDNSVRQQEIYDQMPKDAPLVERVFQKSYIDYTRKQEQVTPQLQRLVTLLRQKYPSATDIPADIREEFHRHSLALMKWNGLLTFNFRSAFFFLFCLLDVPVVHFLFEAIAMTMLKWYVNHRHESFCKAIADKIGD